MTNPVGRPLLFKTADELEKAVENYFNDCLPHPEEYKHYKYHQIDEEYEDTKGNKKTRKVDDKSRPPYEEKRWGISQVKTPTVTGLALALNTSRQTLINYEDKDEFFDTIKKAKDLIEHHWETLLQGNSVTGVIFNLKNNYSWKDKTETDLTSGGKELKTALVEFVNGNTENQSTDSE